MTTPTKPCTDPPCRVVWQMNGPSTYLVAGIERCARHDSVDDLEAALEALVNEPNNAATYTQAKAALAAARGERA